MSTSSILRNYSAGYNKRNTEIGVFGDLYRDKEKKKNKKAKKSKKPEKRKKLRKDKNRKKTKKTEKSRNVKSETTTVKPSEQPNQQKKYEPIEIMFKATARAKEEKIKIIPFDQSVDGMVNQSAIFYGGSKSGKTVLIKHFMYQMRDKFPTVWLFCPTNEQNGDYDGIVPSLCIHDEVTLEKISDLYDQRKAAVKIYNNANNPKTLKKLFDRVASKPAHDYLRTLALKKAEALSSAEKIFSEDLAKKKEKIEEIKKVFENQTKNHYKEIIRANKDKLCANKNLSDDEKISIKYLDFNPNIMVIFDDCMEELKEIIKEGNKPGNKYGPVLKNFFYKGRHAMITHFYTFQDDNRLDNGIRTNAFNSFFTSEAAATHYFQASANSFSPRDKKIAEAVIKELFGDENKEKYKNYKLVYRKYDKHRFQYVCADLHDDFKMGSDYMWDFCKKAKKKKELIDVDNPHMEKFVSTLL